MSAVVHDDDYERLIKRFPLRPIRSEEENERAFEICDELTDRLDELTLGERDYLDVLSTLVAKFESQWEDDVAHMTPREVVEFLMEQNGLAQKDLIPEFGTSSRVSEFLKGHRGLSLEQARRLSDRFKLNVSLFIEKPAVK
jgi:HTH-type transcriptional regulator/antitoxin HigA